MGAFQRGLIRNLTAYRCARATVVYIQGRQHPVEVFYVKEPQPDYVDAALRTFYQIHSDPMPGDVLIFLAGKHLLGYISTSYNDLQAKKI